MQGLHRWWTKHTYKRKHHMLCCICLFFGEWFFCKILYCNYGWPPPPPPLKRVYLVLWNLCDASLIVLLLARVPVYFYHSIILIVQRMRYLCAREEWHINWLCREIACACVWKDKNFKANGISVLNSYLFRWAQDVPNDNDRNKKKLYHSTRIMHV